MAGGEIRLGVIGMGRRNMASTLTLLPREPGLRYRITAACASRAQDIEQTARSFAVPWWTDDYRALARRPDVDVVCVFSPDHLHFEHCREALRQGKHVVCTKPMVTGLADARELVALVRSRKVKFLVGPTMRFDRQFLAARKHLDDGDLGTPIALESHYVHDMRPVFKATPWRRAVPQDLMFGGCVHCIDVLRALGGEIESVHAVANRGGLQAEFTDNRPGQIRVVLDGRAGQEPDVTSFEPERDLSACGHGATVIRHMRHFQECLDTGNEPSPGVLDGAKSVAVGVAAWESIRTGRSVQPAEVD